MCRTSVPFMFDAKDSATKEVTGESRGGSSRLLPRCTRRSWRRVRPRPRCRLGRSSTWVSSRAPTSPSVPSLLPPFPEHACYQCPRQRSCRDGVPRPGAGNRQATAAARVLAALLACVPGPCGETRFQLLYSKCEHIVVSVCPGLYHRPSESDGLQFKSRESRQVICSNSEGG